MPMWLGAPKRRYTRANKRLISITEVRAAPGPQRSSAYPNKTSDCSQVSIERVNGVAAEKFGKKLEVGIRSIEDVQPADGAVYGDDSSSFALTGLKCIDRFVELAVEPIIKIGHGSGRSVGSHPVTFLRKVSPDFRLVRGAASRKS